MKGALVLLLIIGCLSPTLRAGPPLGLKTYRDLALTVDETMLVRPAPDALVKRPSPLKALVPGEHVYALFDPGNRVQFTAPEEGSFWSRYSKDNGVSWSVPRFVCRLESVSGQAASELHLVSVRKVTGKVLLLTLKLGDDRTCELSFKEDDLCRLATQADLDRAPEGAFVLNSIQASEKEVLADSICIGGNIHFEAAHSPKGYTVSTDLGLLVSTEMAGQVIHRARSETATLYETRAVVTPDGDYVVMIPDGRHASSPRADANVMLAYRSTDRGLTWTGPTLPFGDQEKHHAALSLVSPGGRIHVFGTQRGPAVQAAKRDRAFGFRYSDDGARTWSPVELVRLSDGKLFAGTGVIQGTRTAAGSWMFGFHHAKMLRSSLEEGQRTWSLVTPSDKPAPGSLAALYHQDELRVIALDGPDMLTQARTCEGHLWQMRSSDDGRSWSQGEPTSLIHPDAPPMMFHLSDGKTLIALHHNRAVMRSVHESIHSDWLRMPAPSADEITIRNQHRHSLKDWVSRGEVWFSLSTDGGHSWDIPRLLFANALAETLDQANPNYQCSYVDLFVDGGQVHLIIPHRWQRVVHLTFPEAALSRFQTAEEVRQNLSAKMEES